MESKVVVLNVKVVSLQSTLMMKQIKVNANKEKLMDLWPKGCK